MKSKFVFGLLLSACLLLLAGITNFDALGLDSYLTVGTYSTVGSYETIGTYETVGTYVQAGTEVRSPEFQLGNGSGTDLDNLGRIILTVRNKSGAAVHEGKVVEWDTTLIAFNTHKILPNVIYTDTGDVFNTEGAPNGFRILVKGTPSSDSVYLYGTAILETGSALTTEIFSLGTTANDTVYSNYVWTDFDSAKVDSGAVIGLDSLHLDLVPFRAVTISDGRTPLIAGLVINDSIIDNGIGQICVYGEALAKTKPATNIYIRHGWPLVP